MKHLLSVDLEDWFHIVEGGDSIAMENWENLPGRVEHNTRRLLAVFSELKVKATFFVLGWIAERYPDLIGEIMAGGHEIASHGYSHALVYELTREGFEADLERASVAISAVTGESPTGFRSTSFSIRHDCLWALEVLRDRGYEFDSSIFPASRGHGGAPGYSRFPFEISGLMEYPISIISVAGFTLPFSGGGYFRLMPYSIIKAGLEFYEKAGHPAVVYLHPRDIDPDTPRVKELSFIRRFKCYVNVHKAEIKLRRMLAEFEFGSVSEIRAENRL
jgi:polysaccharide deacetylase family protein (PEP-CTERM system associated)